MASISAILLAAGSSRRMQGSVPDKVLASIAGNPAIIHVLEAFYESALIDHVTVVYRDEKQLGQIKTVLKYFENNVHYARGGNERQNSVYNALKEQPDDCKYVFIHDCARPLICPESVRLLYAAVQADGAAALARPATESMKQIRQTDQLRQCDLKDLDRSRIWTMETPQVFSYPSILKAYTHVMEKELVVTDDTAAFATIGLKTTLVPHARPNPKITTLADLNYAEWLLQKDK